MVICERCGKAFIAPAKGGRGKPQCPACGIPTDVPLVGSLELDEAPPRTFGAEDESAYLFSDRELPKCPDCGKRLPLDSVICTACGTNLQTGVKAVREYQRVDRTWDTDMPIEKRLLIVASAEAVFFATSVLSFLGGLEITTIVFFWTIFTGLMLFIFGTFERLKVTRDRKGRTTLIKQWRALFVPLAPASLEVRGFGGVTTGQWYTGGVLEWFICFCFLPVGIVPAIIWYYHAIHKPLFHVALAANHGFPEVYIYRGRSDEQMNDIATTVANASGLKRL
jgi:hypothetical protein